MIHRDVKSMNILLDEHFQAKLGDFGLSRSFPMGSETHVSTNVAGSPGYLDPEYYRTNRLTEKSDVYSFGIVLLEIITTQSAIDQTREKPHITEWVGSRLTNGDIENIVDPNLVGDYDSSSMWKALELAMSCVSPSPSGRPNMSHVANELKVCLSTENSRKRGSPDTNTESSHELSTSFGLEQNPDAR